eukprot:gene26812-30898_t
MTYEGMLQDVKLMKKMNINAVRTSLDAGELDCEQPGLAGSHRRTCSSDDGNEAGTGSNMKAAYQFLKAHDASRPV